MAHTLTIAALAALALAACAPQVRGDANGGMINAWAVPATQVMAAAQTHCGAHGRGVGGVTAMTPTGNTMGFTCR